MKTTTHMLTEQKETCSIIIPILSLYNLMQGSTAFSVYITLPIGQIQLLLTTQQILAINTMHKPLFESHNLANVGYACLMTTSIYLGLQAI